MKKFYFLLFFLLPSVAFADYTITPTEVNVWTNNTEWGYGVDELKTAQEIVTIGAGSVASLEFSAGRVGTPTQGTTVSIYTDSGGSPGTSMGVSGTVTGITDTSSCGTHTATFETPVSLSGATSYWVVFENTTTSSSNYFSNCGNNTADDGISKDMQYSVWQSHGYALYMNVFVDESASLPPIEYTSQIEGSKGAIVLFWFFVEAITVSVGLIIASLFAFRTMRFLVNIVKRKIV